MNGKLNPYINRTHTFSQASAGSIDLNTTLKSVEQFILLYDHSKLGWRIKGFFIYFLHRFLANNFKSL